MIDELTHEGRACRVIGVIGVVDAERWIGDQEDRTALQRILCVHHAPGLADVGQSRGKLWTGRGERGEPRKDAAETIFTDYEGG